MLSILGLERLQQLEAVHPRHHQVGDDDRRAELGDPLERLGAVGGRVGREAPRAHQLGQPAAGGLVVFDDQHALGGLVLAHVFEPIIGMR